MLPSRAVCPKQMYLHFLGLGLDSPLATTYLQPVLLPVHNDGGDLLVHEYQDGAEQSWDECSQHRPPWVGSYGVHEPPTVIPGGLGQSTSISVTCQLGFPLHLHFEAFSMLCITLC